MITRKLLATNLIKAKQQKKHNLPIVLFAYLQCFDEISCAESSISSLRSE